MAKYDRLQWSNGYNSEHHPRNLGGDGLAFFLWDGEPPDYLEYVRDDATEEENGGRLVGWVYVDYEGVVSARFDRTTTDDFDGDLRKAFAWCEAMNHQTDPEESKR